MWCSKNKKMFKNIVELYQYSPVFIKMSVCADLMGVIKIIWMSTKMYNFVLKKKNILNSLFYFTFYLFGEFYEVGYK